MSNDVHTIKERKVVLPTWLDTFIFDKLSAKYCRQNKDMVVLEWGLDDIKKYLGTYFPRSYAESFAYSMNSFQKRKMRMRIAKNYLFLTLVVVQVVN